MLATLGLLEIQTNHFYVHFPQIAMNPDFVILVTHASWYTRNYTRNYVRGVQQYVVAISAKYKYVVFLYNESSSTTRVCNNH